ncbi:gamma-glutamyl-gamma-aminobutyrate hydrolase family protein [Dolosicoccus paucivorans]|uniref:Gamma-glutamyl-gamma-aminobutyrate hydrolase family protein n=1 Tax=Dolosicoccus paucivorans TaxID=84521 RepID=A0A1G8LZZ4_9LACT|nr:gamma-glutamyl-gamma-aminobutyrate hydrolase family protein [Dolosicoccus paucivorans]PMC58017.1 gamma-glutamyl-gamma-aminobutyrate hydrolase family protein [Dolosicoccus paucivorans]SDI61271.1 putative glutamine amidotransferase [Dolosicoccus paucivorans]
MKPVIGITSEKYSLNYTRLKNIPGEATWHGFTNAMIKAGALSVALPFSHVEEVEQYVHLIDGLIVTGGQDVSPSLYGEEPHPKLGELDPVRDEMESALIKEAVRQGKPVLGICRGLQLINAIYGGTLYQDLSQNPNINIQHRQETTLTLPSHHVNIEQDSWLHPVLGDKLFVNTSHHQAIKDLASDFKAIAYSAGDQVIEAIEHKEAPIYGLQWHPEMLLLGDDHASLELFRAFVAKCKK